MECHKGFTCARVFLNSLYMDKLIQPEKWRETL